MPDVAGLGKWPYLLLRGLIIPLLNVRQTLGNPISCLNKLSALFQELCPTNTVMQHLPAGGGKGMGVVTGAW